MTEEKRTQTYQAALAGLLHDIGKFAQRAGIRGSQEHEETIQDFGYYHALLTADTINEIVPAPWRRAVHGAAGYHHRPTNDLGQLVQLADHLSAGEREDDEDNRVPYLESLFSRIYEAGERGYYPLKPLQPESDFIYPYERTAAWQSDHEGEYEDLWEDFIVEARAAPASTLQALVERMLALMQRYTWSIPAAYYRNVPDVSLYDHSRMTGALAACLAVDGRVGTWCSEIRQALYEGGEATERPVAQLVGGDISGIQDYLYTMASGGAAKSLRGRSFYLQLLTEAVALAFLHALDLPLTNLIYAGGGHFYIMAPTAPEVAEIIQRLQSELAEVLLQGHQGRLYLAVTHVAIPAHRFMGGAFSQVWDELKQRLERDKRQRFATLGATRMAEEVGAALGQGGHPDHFCQVCGREGDWGSAGPDELRKCRICESLETLGNQLRTTQALLVSQIPPEKTPLNSWRDGLRALGVDVGLVDEGERHIQAPAGATFVRLWMLRDDPVPRVDTAAPVVESRHLLALVAPRVQRDNQVRVATFEDLAEASQTALKQWGVLRMDVDDLGRLFREGLAERATLSRTATLSFLIRLFFEGHLPALVKRYNSFTHKGTGADKAYVMYAGGDDLFIVGTWEILPELAHTIQQKFSEFTADNSRITLSGGITIHPQKYPLYLAAQEAGAALDREAKGFTRPNGHPKDALAFLGQTVGWESYPAFKAQVEQWVEWVKAGVASKGDLQLLRRAAALHREEQQRAIRAGKLRADQRYLGSWAWHIVYALSRRREKAKGKHPDYVRALDELEEALIEGEAIRAIGWVARWAELLTRGGA